MSSKTDIANMTMSTIRAESNLVNVDTDDSVEAKAFRVYWDLCVSKVFEEYAWTFASRTKELSPLSEDPPPDWAYRYALPSDCVVPREVMTEAHVRNTDALAFDVVLSKDGNTATLVTDTAEAHLRYTSDLFANPGKWPAHFTDAVHHQLASKLAMALKNETVTSESEMNMYYRSLQSARYVDQVGRNLGKAQAPKSVRARR